MIRKYLHHALLALVFMLGLISMQSCERINENKEKVNQPGTPTSIVPTSVILEN